MISTVFNSNYEQLISNIGIEMVVSVGEPLSPQGSIFKILTCLIWALWVHVTCLFTINDASPNHVLTQLVDLNLLAITGSTFLTQKCLV